jgi:hypothetical protein
MEAMRPAGGLVFGRIVQQPDELNAESEKIWEGIRSVVNK